MPARSLATVIANIRDELDRGSDYDSRISTAIQNVIQFYRGKRYGFNQKRAGLTLDAEYVTLPDDFLEIDALKLDDGSNDDPLTEVTSLYIHDQKRSRSYTSQPVYFAVTRNGSTRQLRLYPEPDQTYSAEMTYLFDVAESVSWTSSLEISWFDEGYLVVFNGALGEIEGSFLGDPEMMGRAAAHTAAAQAAERQLRNAANLEQHSDGIEPVI